MRGRGSDYHAILIANATDTTTVKKGSCKLSRSDQRITMLWLSGAGGRSPGKKGWNAGELEKGGWEAGF